jgi:hypothetical protein
MLNMCNSNHEAISWGNPIQCPLCRLTEQLKRGLDSLKEKLVKPLPPEIAEWMSEQLNKLAAGQPGLLDASWGTRSERPTRAVV